MLDGRPEPPTRLGSLPGGSVKPPQPPLAMALQRAHAELGRQGQRVLVERGCFVDSVCPLRQQVRGEPQRPRLVSLLAVSFGRGQREVGHPLASPVSPATRWPSASHVSHKAWL